MLRRRGIDIRYVVTSLPGSDAEHIYRETIYCARGQAENLIKQHKAQLQRGLIALVADRRWPTKCD